MRCDNNENCYQYFKWCVAVVAFSFLSCFSRFVPVFARADLANVKAVFCCFTLLFSFHSFALDWPRTVNNSDGTQVEIKQRPMRILSTSVTVTGTLVAIDAPVIASALTARGTFFEQWRAVAQKKQIQPLWSAGQVDLEAAFMAQPDLIIVSSNGADSAFAHVQELKMIAPVLIVDYGILTWQQLAVQLGQALGLEQQAQQIITQFSQTVDKVKLQIKLPTGQANIVSYNGGGITNPIATANSSHAKLLASLGFDIESPDPNWHSGTKATGDFVRADYEKLTQLTANTTFLLRVNDSAVPAFLADPVLANLPSVKSQQVFGLGENSFRIDYYSATEILSKIQKDFAL